ncbi:MAG TPA: hypothetical protein VNT51_04335 [Miltoncostaeaceae bacterium]|nr:hypothetical protein [Miltoncostaeaceae bacterium]
MLGKRYTVAVVGLGGSSAAQRSEVNRFRRERDALACAADERDRLAVAHGAGARNYQVVVERDGVVVEALSPEAPPDDLPLARRREPDPDPEPEILDRAPEPADEDGPEPSGLIDEGDEDMSDTAGATILRSDRTAAEEPAAAHAADAGRRPRRTERMPAWDDVPSGRVPEDVLRYFEDAVAREEQRRARRRGDEADG